MYTLLEDENPKHKFASKDELDNFLVKIYRYYIHRGFSYIVLSELFNILSLAFIIFWSSFLTIFIDYKTLLRTHDIMSSISYGSVNPIVMIFICIFSVFWIYSLIKFPFTIYEYWKVHTFYRSVLNIKNIHDYEWYEIVHLLENLKHLCYHKESYSSLDIANIILRRDNYLISMVNLDILNFYNHRFFTKVFEWCLFYVVFNFFFKSNNIRRDIFSKYKHPILVYHLKIRFVCMGIASFILSPFVLSFLLIYIFFKHAERIKTKPSILGLRDWSLYARYKFRDLNEYPHLFQQRLNQSYYYAQTYSNMHHSPLLGLCIRFIVFVIGSIFIVFVIIGLLDSDLLTKTEIGNVNLLFLTGILGTILTFLRNSLPSKHTYLDPKDTLNKVMSYIHYTPDTWISTPHKSHVRDEFLSLFEYRLVLVIFELLSVFIVPFIFIFKMPKFAENIVNFFRDYTADTDNNGSICKVSAFNEHLDVSHQLADKLQYSINNFNSSYV